jgi:diguanylate cyclase (GGDEF)-like protein
MLAMKEHEPFRHRVCDFSGSEQLCLTLDKAGVPHDPKWRTLIIYMRGLEHYDFLSTKQKSQIQALVLHTLREKDYSEETYRTIIKKQEEILNAPCNERLQAALSETASMVEEFRKLLTRRRGDVEHLHLKTVDTIQNGGDPETMIASLKASFHAIVAEMKKDAEDLTLLSMTDALTNLSNRRAFNERLEETVAQALEDEKSFSLIMFDIDHFKLFNDNYGHRIGDQALATVSMLLKKYEETNFITGFFPARYGGEEFSVILPGLDEKAGIDIAEALRQNIQNYNFVIRGPNGEILKRGIHITVSAGVASLRFAWGGAYCENLVDAADKALYAAKATGRNKVVGSSQLAQIGKEKKS